MTDLGRRVADDALELALRDLSPHIDWPTGPTAPDLATRVQRAIVAGPSAAAGARWSGWRPMRRALALALVAVLVLAALAAALALGLPGLRIRLAEPASTPPPTAAGASGASGATPGASEPGVPGSRLGLGRLVALDEVERLTGSSIGLPVAADLGPPDAAYVDEGRANQVALVWSASGGLPGSREPGVGLVLMRFDGTVDDGFYEKVVGGGTSVVPISVRGHGGFWISGDPHLFFYRTAGGQSIDDSRRWVGDALIWSDGRMTFRLESALGREAAIALAESIE